MNKVWPLVIKIFPLTFALAIFLYFALIHLLTIPSVWSDEAMIADSVYNLLHENRLGMDLWKGLSPESYDFGLAYPPFYYYLLAGWVKLFGFSIINMRLLSILISMGFIVVLFFILKKIVGEKISREKIFSGLQFLLLISLLLDNTFQKMARLGRPEIQVIFLAAVSLLFYYLSNQTQLKNSLRNICILLSGLFIGLSVLTHYSAILYFVAFLFVFAFSDRVKIFKSPRFCLFLGPALLPIFVWFISVLPNLNNFWALFKGQIGAHQIGPTWFWVSMAAIPSSERIIYLIYVIVSWEFITYCITNKASRYILVALILIFSWAIVLIWRIEPGFGIIVFPVYISLFILLNEYYQKRSAGKLNRFNVLITLTFCIFILNLLTQIKNLANFPQGTFSYNKYTDSILKIIPDYKTVYVLAIPDPYFGFKQNNRHNSLQLFPMMQVSRKDFIKMLNSVDYIIYNLPLDSQIVGDYTRKYIDRNSKQTYRIWEPAEYSAYIIELKSPDQRVTDL